MFATRTGEAAEKRGTDRQNLPVLPSPPMNVVVRIGLWVRVVRRVPRSRR
jgi:hypothetical protein